MTRLTQARRPGPAAPRPGVSGGRPGPSNLRPFGPGFNPGGQLASAQSVYTQAPRGGGVPPRPSMRPGSVGPSGLRPGTNLRPRPLGRPSGAMSMADYGTQGGAPTGYSNPLYNPSKHGDPSYPVPNAVNPITGAYDPSLLGPRFGEALAHQLRNSPNFQGPKSGTRESYDYWRAHGGRGSADEGGTPPGAGGGGGGGLPPANVPGSPPSTFGPSGGFGDNTARNLGGMDQSGMHAYSNNFDPWQNAAYRQSPQWAQRGSTGVHANRQTGQEELGGIPMDEQGQNLYANEAAYRQAGGTMDFSDQVDRSNPWFNMTGGGAAGAAGAGAGGGGEWGGAPLLPIDTGGGGQISPPPFDTAGWNTASPLDTFDMPQDNPFGLGGGGEQLVPPPPETLTYNPYGASNSSFGGYGTPSSYTGGYGMPFGMGGGGFGYGGQIPWMY